MLDKFLAVISIIALIGFMSFVVIWVNEPDLWIITVVVLLMAAYDFYRSTRNSGKNKENQGG